MQLQLHGNKIWLFREPVDFRQSITGLSTLIVERMQQDPQKGIYLFYNRNGDKVKCLSWHKNGFILLYKKLAQGRFKFSFKSSGGVTLTSEEVGWLLAGLEWQTMRDWKELNYDKFS